MAGSTNVQNEKVQKLDVLSNEILKHLLTASGKTALLISEEEEDLIYTDDAQRGTYCVVFDPLDGSSNIDCGVTVGTIFGVYKVKAGSIGDAIDVLRPGKDMAAAGECMLQVRILDESWWLIHA